MHQGGPVAERGEPLPGEAQRLRVAVEPDQPDAGEGGQQRLAVPAEAERGVDDDGAGLGERRGEQVEAAPEHDGDVQRSHGQRLLPASPDRGRGREEEGVVAVVLIAL